MGNPTWAFSMLIWAFFCFRVSGNGLQDLDTQVQNEAFKAIRHKKTGIIYNVTVPPEYSGVTVQVMRLRTGSLKRRGVKFNEFTVPKGASVERNPRSVLMVYKNFGHNSSYFRATDYEFVAPVVGILVYNYSVTPGSESQPQLELIAGKDSISIEIPIYVSSVSRPSCALLNSTGGLDKISVLASPPYICNSSQLGEVSLVIRSPSIAPEPNQDNSENPTERMGKKGSNAWKIAVGAALGGIAALLALALLIFWGRKEVDKAKIAKMEKHADNEETLQTSLIGNSRAPTAGGTRTKPVLENEDST